MKTNDISNVPDTLYILHKDDRYCALKRGEGFVETAPRAMDLGVMLRDAYASMPERKNFEKLEFTIPDDHHPSFYKNFQTLSEREKSEFLKGFENLGRNL